MKCPKCGYVGFESSEKCRNCGYHFSLAEPAADLELPLGDASEAAPDGLQAGNVDLAGLAVPASSPARGPERIRRAESRAEVRDLPLFGNDTASMSRVEAPSPRLRPRHPADDTKPDTAKPTPQLPQPIPARTARTITRVQAPDDAAAPASRLIAFVLDVLILGGLNAGVLYFTLSLCRLSFGDMTVLPAAPLVAFFAMLDGSYLVAFVAHGGQTIGKMATSIRVTAEDGGPVGASQAFLRATCYMASILPAGLGFVPGLFGPTRRALHDRLAATRVVRVG